MKANRATHSVTTLCRVLGVWSFHYDHLRLQMSPS